MKRKLLSILLTLCLAFSLLPTAALAEGEGTQTNDVAQIGSTGYESLAAAIEAAKSGNTVKLLRDTKENVTIDKAMTLDLNGHTLNGGTEKGKPALTITARTVTIKDSSEAQTGTIMREDTAENSGVSSHYVIDIQGNAWVMFESGNVKNNSGNTAGKDASLVRVGDDSVDKFPGLNIKGGTFTQDNFIVIKVDRGDLFLNGGTLSSANSYAVENWFRATIKGGTVNGAVSSWTYSGGSNSTLEISGGTVNGAVTSVNYGDADKVAKVEITGGTVTGELDTRSYDPTTGKLTSITDVAKSTIKVTGGTFSSDPTNYVVENSSVTNNSDGTFGVAKAYLAKVGETSYYTMDEAFKAQTTSGEPVVLLRDYTTGGTFNSGSINRTVDLNGYTWTYTGTNVNDAAFEINYSDVTLTVKNGTVVSGSMVGLIPSAMGGTIKYDNSGLVLEGVKATANGNSGIETNGNNTNDNVTLRNSTLNVPNGFGIYFPSSGTLTIDNSTINAKTMGVQVCAGSLNINDGSKITVNGDAVPKTESDGAIQDGAAISIVNRSGYKGLGNIAVTGGTFTAKDTNAAIKAYDWNNTNQTEDPFTESTKVSVSGGTFTSAVPENCCAPGFVPTQNGNTHGVKIKANMAAEVLDAQGKTVGAYDTLAAAITAAKNGETVKLLKDVELTSTLNLAKNITIDGQGKYTIKAANNFIVGKDNNTCCVLYVSGEVTLKDVTVNGNEKCRVIFCDKGKLTIDGATITNGKAPNFIGGVYMTSSASFEMKSGSITGNKNAELYQNEKYLQYSSDLWIGANANGALTAINGGTIGNVFVNANAWSASNPGSFTMNGGTVTNLYVEHDANYGATFKYNDGTIEHLYLSKENGNGQSIEVTPVKGVIYNGGVKEEDLVTLTLKYNDGATADTTYNVASGTTITLPTPRRSGYTFNGWYDGSKFYAAGASYTVSATVTLNASWSYISSGSSSYDPTYSVSTPSKTENGSVTVSPKNASKGDTVTVTVKPDSGYVLETLTVTDKNGNELTLKDKGNGKYTFTMPAGKVEVKATFMEDNSMLNFFYDVPNNAYFYEAVKWAVKNGITTGVGDNLFAPEQPCTRAQIVTFLWRAAGSPEPKGAASGMSDVVSGSYYEKAVAWAIENGITTGTTTSTFSPDATCTRAQAVTFLARALKAKAASAAEFSDVPTGSYFADAVAWAAANGVTEGIGGGLFGSGNTCTRAQIVTFLYRAYQGK